MPVYTRRTSDMLTGATSGAKRLKCPSSYNLPKVRAVLGKKTGKAISKKMAKKEGRLHGQFNRGGGPARLTERAIRLQLRNQAKDEINSARCSEFNGKICQINI
jgi:hypothetical protein